MSVAQTVLALVLAAFFASLGTGKVLAVPSMRQRAADIGCSVTAYRGIGALELAGALGLLVGIAVVPLRWAAGVGLLLLLAGAVTAHVRRGDGPAAVAPAVVAAIVVIGYLLLGGVAA